MRYITEFPAAEVCLIALSEEELLRIDATYPHLRHIEVFCGTVLRCDNIEVALKNWTNCYCLVQVRVDNVYRANCAAGDVVTVLSPMPSGAGCSLSLEMAGQLRLGMEGIFLSVAYAEDDALRVGDAALYWRDLAPYGLSDGIRDLLLQGQEGGLIYEEFAWPSLAEAQTLNDAGRILLAKLG